MRGQNRDLSKAGIVIAGVLFLLVLIAWVTVSATGAEARASGLVTPVAMQATPTEDATVTALNKEKLAQEVRQLQQANDHSISQWLWSNLATIVSSFLSTFVVVAGLIVAFRQWSMNRQDAQGKELQDRQAERERRDEEQKRWLEDRKAERERRDEEQQRWLKDQEAEREKLAEERFQAAVTGLGDEREGAKIGAAILLRTFLRPEHKQFYTQTFDLAVANLRLPRLPHPPKDSHDSLPLTTLRLALIVVFREAFPLARDREKRSPQSLDATGIQLYNAYLSEADLKRAWMPQSLLRKADLSEADLGQAKLTKAKLFGAKLRSTYLPDAHLSQAWLSSADLTSAYLVRTDLRLATFHDANLTGSDLTGADLSWADLSWADLTRVNLESALSLSNANLHGVQGLTKEQLASCKAKGALVDEDSTTSSPQPIVAPSPSSQSNDAQAPTNP